MYQFTFQIQKLYFSSLVSHKAETFIIAVVCLLLMQGIQIPHAFFAALIYFPTPLLCRWRTQASEKWWLWKKEAAWKQQQEEDGCKTQSSLEQNFKARTHALTLLSPFCFIRIYFLLQTPLTVWGLWVYLKKSMKVPKSTKSWGKE